jgi:signal transduction histidine kinase
VENLSQRAKQLESELDVATTRIGEVDRMRDLFVSAASHELRTPLTVLKSSVDLLRHAEETHLTEEQILKLLEEIGTACESLESLVEDIVDLSQMERGEVVLRTRPTSLNRLASEVAGTLKPVSERFGIRLVEALDEAMPEINLDEIKMRHPLVQLVAAAIRSTPNGGQVTIKTYQESGMAVLEVEDEGPSLSDAETEHAFDLFAQNLRKYVHKLPDMGVGLHLVKLLAEMHGGEVSADNSRENRNAYFIRLPIRSDQISVYSKVA